MFTKPQAPLIFRIVDRAIVPVIVCALAAVGFGVATLIASF